MTAEEDRVRAYLEELHRTTGEDTEVQVSMYEVGAAIGLDKGEAGSLAEELMVQGQAELRTLAGGISITVDGLAALGIRTGKSGTAEQGYRLSGGPVADLDDRETMQLIMAEIKQAISGQKLAYELVEEMVLDLKTLEVQLLSAKPKTNVLREVLRSLHDALQEADAGTTAARLQSLL